MVLRFIFFGPPCCSTGGCSLVPSFALVHSRIFLFIKQLLINLNEVVTTKSSWSNEVIGIRRRPVVHDIRAPSNVNRKEFKTSSSFLFILFDWSHEPLRAYIHAVYKFMSCNLWIISSSKRSRSSGICSLCVFGPHKEFLKGFDGNLQSLSSVNTIPYHLILFACSFFVDEAY